MKKTIFVYILISVLVLAFLPCTALAVNSDTDLNYVSNGYYSLEFTADYLTHEKVFITGIHQNLLPDFEQNLVNSLYSDIGYMESPYFIDAEKTATTDDLCWAAATSNMLQYSGYAKDATFDFDNAYVTNDYALSGEDAIFNYFAENFDNKPSNAILALNWFFNGVYESNSTTIARPLEGSTGGKVRDDIIANYIMYPIEFPDSQSTNALYQVAQYLNAGGATCMMINWRNAQTQKSGNHVITLWGYSYIENTSINNENYCLSLFYTDSDDDEPETYGMPAPNKLRKMDIKICTAEDVANNPLLKTSDIGKIYSSDYWGFMTAVGLNVLSIAPQVAIQDDFTTTVTTLNDTASFADGKISLREAVLYAKYRTTPVTFDPSLSGQTFNLSIPLSINSKLTIDASALSEKPTLIVLDSPTNIDYGAINVYDTGNLTLINTKVTSDTNSPMSGIFNNGVVTLQDCVIFDNQSESGGGIYNNGNLTIIDCEIKNNSTTLLSGGGIFCTETSTLTLKGVVQIYDNTSIGTKCNLVLNSTNTLNVDELSDGSTVGIYAHDLDGTENSLLCYSPLNRANKVAQYFTIDNEIPYEITPNFDNSALEISLKKTISCLSFANTHNNHNFILFLIALTLPTLLVTLSKKKRTA